MIIPAAVCLKHVSEKLVLFLSLEHKIGPINERQSVSSWAENEEKLLEYLENEFVLNLALKR